MSKSEGSSLCGVVVVAAMWTCTVGVGIQEFQHIKTFNLYDGSRANNA
jgi:hypothetical protein